MSGAKLQVVTAAGAPPRRTDERERLAAAIAERDEKLLAEAQCRGLFRDAEDHLMAALSAKRRAAAVAEGARAAYAAHALEAALGKGHPDDAPITPAEARRRLEDAEDQVETCRAVRDGLNTELGTLKMRAEFAANRAEQCAQAVLRSVPAVQRLVEDVGHMQQELAEKTAALRFLVSKNAAVADRDVLWRADAMVKLNQWQPLLNGIDSTAPFAAALFALQQNADAMPEL